MLHALFVLWLLVSVEPAASGVLTMGTSHQTPIPPGWGQLEQFVFHPDPYHAEVVPRRLHREVVASFIDERILAATPRGALAQAEKVVDFYDLQESCPHLKSLAAKNEKTPDDIRRSTVVVRSIAHVCLPPDLAFASDYATHLVALSSTLPEFQDLIALNDALAGGLDSAQLKSRMKIRLEALGQKRQGDYQAQIEYGNLEDAMNTQLMRSLKANELKVSILAMPNRSQRIAEEIRMYLGLHYGYIEYLQPWAARRLRRETWASQPSQQTQRGDNRELRQEVALSFRAAVDSLAPSRELPKENIPSLRVRCLRAIDYFGGAVSPNEHQFVEQNAAQQLDPLSN